MKLITSLITACSALALSTTWACDASGCHGKKSDTPVVSGTTLVQADLPPIDPAAPTQPAKPTGACCGKDGKCCKSDKPKCCGKDGKCCKKKSECKEGCECTGCDAKKKVKATLPTPPEPPKAPAIPDIPMGQ